MLGAEALVRSLADSGIEVCFSNPGTSEMHLVAALVGERRMRTVLGLAEVVVSGAADGYARVAGRPPSTLLHLGPGFANGWSNLHNARRAASPIVNIVGDHATYHRKLDAPLTSDVAALAHAVSAWVCTVSDANAMASAGAAAVAAAREPPGRLATLIVPADASWSETEAGAAPISVKAREAVPNDRIEGIARVMRGGAPCALMVGGAGLSERGLDAASRLTNATGARLFCPTFTARHSRGAGRVLLERLPYFPELVMKALDGVRHLVLAAAKPPVSFFAYPGAPSSLVPSGCDVHLLAEPNEDVETALVALADALGARGTPITVVPLAPPPLPSGAIDPPALGAVLANTMPEGAIVADEAVTARFAALAQTVGAQPHDWLCQTGGSLGLGMPMALGAAIAAPDRRVINIQADGSAMYAPQALWSFAREGANVTTIVIKNRRYRVLELEFQRLGLDTTAPQARDLFAIAPPDIDFVGMARSMGVPASRATSVEELESAMRDAVSEPGPRLIEAIMA
jgi:acetolactate synthase I/II/III large subunit